MSPIGAYVPPRVARSKAPPIDPALVARLVVVSGLTAAIVDELDRLGIRTAVPASVAPPLRAGDVVVGRAVTLRYLPTRSFSAGDGRLAHMTLFDIASAGDVAVVSAPIGVDGSVLGGRAAVAGRDAGLAGCVVFGYVRDVDELIAADWPVWASARTAATGRGRIEAIEINGPIEVGGVHVVPGDVVVADGSGIVFVPAEHADEVFARVLDAV